MQILTFKHRARPEPTAWEIEPMDEANDATMSGIRDAFDEVANLQDEVAMLRAQIAGSQLRYTSVRPEGDTSRRYWVRGIAIKQGVPSVSIHRLSEIPKFWKVEFAGPIPEPEN